MLNIPAEDAEGNVKQALSCKKAGCEIIRLTVPNKEAVKTLAAVKEKVSIPVVADIHFDYRCALESVAAGADKIRINPGNIGSDDRVKAVADACRAKNIPIRIGVNSGSLEKDILAKYGAPTPDALLRERALSRRAPRKIRFSRYSYLHKILRRADHGLGIQENCDYVRLSASSRRNRGRHAPYGAH